MNNFNHSLSVAENSVNFVVSWTEYDMEISNFILKAVPQSARIGSSFTMTLIQFIF